MASGGRTFFFFFKKKETLPLLACVLKQMFFKCVFGAVASLTEQKEAWMQYVGGREWEFMGWNRSKKGSMYVWYYFPQISIEFLGQEFWIYVWVCFYWFLICFLQYFLSLTASATAWLVGVAFPLSVRVPGLQTLQGRGSTGLIHQHLLPGTPVAWRLPYGHVMCPGPLLCPLPVHCVPLGLLPVPSMGRVVVIFLLLIKGHLTHGTYRIM